MITKLASIALICISSAFAANEGKILSITFTGVADTWHKDIVQITIENGYLVTGCDQTFAAIRKSESHLISAALTAYSMGAKIKVQLNPADKYYPDRCTISSLSIVRN